MFGSGSQLLLLLCAEDVLPPATTAPRNFKFCLNITNANRFFMLIVFVTVCQF
jgi:hypothetical protein